MGPIRSIAEAADGPDPVVIAGLAAAVATVPVMTARARRRHCVMTARARLRRCRLAGHA
jgi:hypothetical protein